MSACAIDTAGVIFDVSLLIYSRPNQNLIRLLRIYFSFQFVVYTEGNVEDKVEILHSMKADVA